MSAIVLNLSVEQGVTFSQDIALTGVDLTDYVLSSQIRAVANYTSPVLAYPTVAYEPANSTNPPVPITEFNLSLTPAQTLALPVFGKNYSTPVPFTYDVIGTKLDGTITRFVNGIISVSPAVTR